MSETEELRAGRELDALVAEKVMQGADWQQGANPYRDCPRYSTDIAAAWQVVEKLRTGITASDDAWERFGNFVNALDTVILARNGRPGVCGLTPFGLLRELTPEDICRAALRAVEHLP